MPPTPDTFGSRVRRAREAAGLSQTDLAELCGFSRQRIWQFENDQQGTPYPHTVAKLANALSVDASELDPRANYNGSQA